MLLQLAKVACVSIVVTFTIAASFVALKNCIFPTVTNEAAFTLPGTSSTLAIQIVNTHPFLAEYDRILIYRRMGFPDQAFKMSPDSGGFKRTQLYNIGKGVFIADSFFESFLIDTNRHFISEFPRNPSHLGGYLGAFDDTRTTEWRFRIASESLEQALIPKGG